MKLRKSLVYPLGAILIVAAFWGTLATVQKAQQGGSGEGTGQGLGSALRSLGIAPNRTSAEGGRNWWGAKVRARTLEVDEEEAAIAAAEVLELRPGSPAATAGLRKGDMIVGIRRQQLTGVAQLEQAVAAVSPGGQLSLQVVRSGEPLDLIVMRGGSSSGGGLAPITQGESPQAAFGAGSPPQAGTGIFVNERELSPQQVEQLRATYGYVAPPGRYWYDPRSGLYGVMGREAAGFMQTGHDFGPLPGNASNGNTGVFINGRQINMTEAMFCQRLFGAVYQGRWWLDGRTGNLGMEGSPMPVANVFMALQQAQRSSQGGGYSWHSKTTGAYGGSDGKCSYVAIPGSGTVMTGACD